MAPIRDYWISLSDDSRAALWHTVKFTMISLIFKKRIRPMLLLGAVLGSLPFMSWGAGAVNTSIRVGKFPPGELFFDFREENMRFSHRNSPTPALRQVKWFPADEDGTGLQCRMTVSQDDGVIYGFNMEGVLPEDIHSNDVFAVALWARVRSTDAADGMGRAQLILGEATSPWRTIINQKLLIPRDWKVFYFPAKSAVDLPHPMFILQLGGCNQVIDVKDLVLVRFPQETDMRKLAASNGSAEDFIRTYRQKK